MSGYEKSRDYGNPPALTWQQWAKAGLVVAAVVAFILVCAGCATSDHDRFVSACITSGKPAASCECAASKSDELLAQGTIDRSTVLATILYIEGKEEESERTTNLLPYDKRYSQGALLGAATDECWR